MCLTHDADKKSTHHELSEDNEMKSVVQFVDEIDKVRVSLGEFNETPSRHFFVTILVAAATNGRNFHFKNFKLSANVHRNAKEENVVAAVAQTSGN